MLTESTLRSKPKAGMNSESKLALLTEASCFSAPLDVTLLLVLDHGWTLWEEMEDVPYKLLCLLSYAPRPLIVWHLDKQ